MRRILLVEDDATLGKTLHERLEKEGYQVAWARTEEAAIESFGQSKWDLVILDLGLPDGSGFNVATEIKKSSSCPFIFVTAQNNAEIRLKGYESGAEEFIPKPFHLKELLMRVEHVLHNHAPAAQMHFNGLVINYDKMSVQVYEDQPQNLALKDFKILQLLISRAPQIVSRDEVLNRVWGEDDFPSHRTVDNSIVRIRQYLSDNQGKYIKSIRGVGYQWVAVEVKAPAKGDHNE